MVTVGRNRLVDTLEKNEVYVRYVELPFRTSSLGLS